MMLMTTTFSILIITVGSSVCIENESTLRPLNKSESNATTRTMIDDGSMFSTNILNIGNEINYLLSSVSNECRESIITCERHCYANYVDRYEDLSHQVINEDISSEFDRKVCCSMWDWFDCTRSRIQQRCMSTDVDLFEQSLLDSYIHSSYCKGYEYGSYYCWPLPLWLYILFTSMAFAMLTLGTVAIVWYWRHGFSCHHRDQQLKQVHHDYRRRRRRRQSSMDFYD
ncbi:hypothetical protein HUG17_0005 [Dermatophagoides farinae]|uniref:Uncharacterized protein n=1 Tax=Dermatophagoides farinae TaxID=6954 RepID=A0A9D4SJQ9_DERFA|nr:uncharacterized protein LOC124499307 [Dermatophagoides farinae]KAH7644467.1 hypothetical protein HUG17_0005 [Dermatophagoides farinae]